jgi:RNA recognition motif-containing protein
MAKKLYVGNLSYNTDDASLEAAFSADGRSCLSARVITDRDTGRSRGFGFVEFDDDGDAQAAMEAMDGQDLDGRTLRVNEANDRR